MESTMEPTIGTGQPTMESTMSPAMVSTKKCGARLVVLRSSSTYHWYRTTYHGSYHGVYHEYHGVYHGACHWYRTTYHGVYHESYHGVHQNMWRASRRVQIIFDPSQSTCQAISAAEQQLRGNEQRVPRLEPDNADRTCQNAMFCYFFDAHNKIRRERRPVTIAYACFAATLGTSPTMAHASHVASNLLYQWPG